MPTFNNDKELREYLLKKSYRAVENVQEQVYRVIEDFIVQYYNDYSPSEYVRTYKLLTSFVKSDVRPTGNGWEADVYFDMGELEYAKKVSTQTWSGMVSATWGAKEVLGTALHGSHGGYKRTAPIYGQSLNVLNANAINALKNALIQAGIPVK